MKKGKVSKADKTKALKEEQKKREKEEEELRLQREQEERERLERERKRREKQEWLEQKDRERRGDELNELSQMLEDNYVAVTKWQVETKQKAKWNRYMTCDGSPNPSVAQEINAFINLWREDPEVQITPVLQDISLALRLIEELEGISKERGEQSEKEAQQDRETLLSLRSLVHSKLYLASEEILKRASTNVDMESGNMQTVIRDEKITLCLWANLSKNARLKDVSFSKAGLGFEMPKQVAVNDTAVRMLHTRYDHLSPLSREVQSQATAALVEEAPPETEQKEKGEMEAEEESQENDDADAQSEKANSRKSAASVRSEKGKKRNGALPQEPTAEEVENEPESQPEEPAPVEEPVDAPTDPCPLLRMWTLLTCVSTHPLVEFIILMCFTCHPNPSR
ncbi:hypothetical protein AGOR_G00181950 [Albula goreensis]|uniref:Dynein axonemal intermediate chain 7 n=1 Tax=Albula goreensis TaxID=1534307 RepID=A0A8T3D0G0_9TELE|nr:hypothetical protein AGOR_G00181950 [Albula goreensis]